MATEKRLIEYDKVYEYAWNGVNGGAMEYEDFDAIINAIDAVPTVDAVEVVHGRWKQTGMHLLPYECSVCGSEEEGRTNYCLNCGARMDLEAI